MIMLTRSVKDTDQLLLTALQVAVPQFKRSQSNADELQKRLAQLPRRRTGDSIMAGMQAEADKAWRAPAPMPSGNCSCCLHQLLTANAVPQHSNCRLPQYAH